MPRNDTDPYGPDLDQHALDGDADPTRSGSTTKFFLLVRYPIQRDLDYGLPLVDKYFRGHTVNGLIDLVTLFYLEIRACSRLQGLTICPAQHKYLEMSPI